MSFVTHPTQSNRRCTRCGKGAIAARQRSHSMRSTNRTIWKNLQQTKTGLFCTKCMKTNARQLVKSVA